MLKAAFIYCNGINFNACGFSIILSDPITCAKYYFKS